MSDKYEERFWFDDSIDAYNIHSHNTTFSSCRKKEIVLELTAIAREYGRLEKLYYDLQYGFLDTSSEDIPFDDVFLPTKMDAQDFVREQYQENHCRRIHYEALVNMVDALDVLPDDHIETYKSKNPTWYKTLHWQWQQCKKHLKRGSTSKKAKKDCKRKSV